MSVLPASHNPEKPLRLDIAAKIAFPDGTMGASGLRKERDRGRLVTEMIAGKEYTTLAAIERMRELCRVPAKEPALSGERKAGRLTGHSGAKPAGTSKTVGDVTPQDVTRMRLKKLSDSLPSTSRKSTCPRKSGTVVPIR